MIAHRYHHAVVFDPKRSRIYVFGGLGSQDQVLDEDLPLNSCEYYDIKTDQWSLIEPLPQGSREQAAATLFNSDTIYLFCGTSKQSIQAMKTFDKYSILFNEWQKLEL
jgi:N-acetylneuraminic acid mutarotase